MIKRYIKRKQEEKKFYRTNERIFAHTLRVLDAQGKQIGVISKVDALAKAKEEGVDLVEVVPQANPPVAKLIDFQKFLYQEEKKKREEKRKAKVSDTKEIRLGPFMSDNDLQVMVRRARDFFEDGDKVRLIVKFRGRQVTHPEFGYEVIKKFFNSVMDISKMDRDPRLEGKQMIAVLSPERKKHEKKEDQQVSVETV